MPSQAWINGIIAIRKYGNRFARHCCRVKISYLKRVFFSALLWTWSLCRLHQRNNASILKVQYSTINRYTALFFIADFIWCFFIVRVWKHCHAFSLKLMAKQSSNTIQWIVHFGFQSTAGSGECIALLLSFILSVSSFSQFFIQYRLDSDEI